MGRVQLYVRLWEGVQSILYCFRERAVDKSLVDSHLVAEAKKGCLQQTGERN